MIKESVIRWLTNSQDTEVLHQLVMTQGLIQNLRLGVLRWLNREAPLRLNQFSLLHQTATKLSDVLRSVTNRWESAGRKIRHQKLAPLKILKSIICRHTKAGHQARSLCAWKEEAYLQNRAISHRMLHIQHKADLLVQINQQIQARYLEIAPSDN